MEQQIREDVLPPDLATVRISGYLANTERKFAQVVCTKPKQTVSSVKKDHQEQLLQRNTLQAIFFAFTRARSVIVSTNWNELRDN